MSMSRLYTPKYAAHNHNDHNDIKEWGKCPACDILIKAENNEANQKDAGALKLAEYNDRGIIRWDSSYDRNARGS